MEKASEVLQDVLRIAADLRRLMNLNKPEAIELEALLDIINSSARQAIAEYNNTGHGVPGSDAAAFYPLDSATDTVAPKKAVRLLEGAYNQLSAILAPPKRTVMNVCIDVALRARIADILDGHPEGLSMDRLAEVVNLDKSKTARVLLSLMVERDVFANTLGLSLILKSTNNTGYFAGFHSQDVAKYAGVLYESMTDEEFSRSHEPDKAPRVLAFRKEGMKGNYWQMINDEDEKRETFHRGMPLGLNEMMGGSAVLHHYPWDNISSVDLPEVLLPVEAQNAWEKNTPEALLDGRVEFVPINFLEDVPAVGKDVHYDRDSTTILRNISRVMGRNSRVLIHDCVLLHSLQEPDIGTDGLSIAPEPMLPSFEAGAHRSYQMDMTMWLILNSKERTLDELKILGQVHLDMFAVVDDG
ncbi:hypothetical protein BDR03DRAFT_1017687 [Suillus americanus]|nr:hypothetical protein BDR03DRAFT_1017687 [Suillus americanus]